MRQRGHQFGENNREHHSATCPRGLFAVVTWVIHTAFVCKGYGGAGGRKGAGLEDDRWRLSSRPHRRRTTALCPPISRDMAHVTSTQTGGKAPRPTPEQGPAPSHSASSSPSPPSRPEPRVEQVTTVRQGGVLHRPLPLPAEHEAFLTS